MDVVVEVVRSGLVESEHRGSAVLVDPAGQPVWTIGDPSRVIFPRSANKPFQAVAMVRAGLALEPRLLALAAASHSAEPVHLSGVREILTGAGLDETALQTPVSYPLDPHEHAAVIRAGEDRAPIRMDCSGKHAAMLAVCIERGWPLGSYLEPTHPLQVEIRAAVAKASGLPDVAFGVDGCGLPTFWMPLSALARSFQWLHASGDPRAVRVLDAIARHPEMVGGTANSDTDTPAATKGRIVSKYGAVGVVAAVDRSSGQALALKMAAGASQPARAVGIGVMHKMGWLRPGEAERLEAHLRPPMRNHMGVLVGHLETRL